MGEYVDPTQRPGSALPQPLRDGVRGLLAEALVLLHAVECDVPEAERVVAAVEGRGDGTAGVLDPRD